VVEPHVAIAGLGQALCRRVRSDYCDPTRIAFSGPN